MTRSGTCLALREELDDVLSGTRDELRRTSQNIVEAVMDVIINDGGHSDVMCTYPNT